MNMALREVTPTKRDDRKNRRDYVYSFREIHIDDVAGDEFGDNVEILEFGDGFFKYRYGDGPILIVNRYRIQVGDNADMEEAEKRAYFMVDILDDHGKVSGWRRVRGV